MTLAIALAETAKEVLLFLSRLQVSPALSPCRTLEVGIFKLAMALDVPSAKPMKR